MRHWIGQRYWLVGASEGLGRALAQKMSLAGAELILSARNADALQDLAEQLPGQAQILPLDVTDQASLAEAAQSLGKIHGMVYLAGAYAPMSAQNWDSDSAAMMVDVNLTGAIRAVGAALPQMLARGGGHIVLTGSLSGYRGLPGAIGYGASKAGLMSLAESMQADLRHTGIETQLINPGFIRTRLTDKNNFRMPFLMEPDAAAEAMLKQMAKKQFSANFPRLFSYLFRAARLMPDWMYFPLFGAKS